MFLKWIKITDVNLANVWIPKIASKRDVSEDISKKWSHLK